MKMPEPEMDPEPYQCQSNQSVQSNRNSDQSSQVEHVPQQQLETLNPLSQREDDCNSDCSSGKGGGEGENRQVWVTATRKKSRGVPRNDSRQHVHDSQKQVHDRPQHV